MGDKLIVTRRVGAVNVITTGDRTVVSRDRRQVVSVGTRGPAGPAGAAGPAGPAGAAGYPTPVSPGVPLVGKTDGSGVEFTSSILGGLAFYSQLRNALSSTFQIDDDGTEYYTSIVTETGTYAITINQDKVGVNTAVVSPTPAARLHVYDDFGTQLRLQGYTQSTDFQTLSGGLFVSTTGSNIYHQVGGGTTAQFISATGIGVGTTIPLARHDIRTGSASTVGQIIRGAVGQTADLQRWQNSTGTTLARVDSTGSVSGNILNATSYIVGRGTITTESTPGGSGSVVVAASDSGPNRIDTYNYIDLGLGDGPNQYSASLYLTCDGFGVPFLGLGNSTPAAPLDIVRTDTQIKLAYSAGGSYDCTVNGDLAGLTLNAFSGGAVRLQTAGTTRLFANASGVGLGTASPSARLDVRTGATTTVGQVIRGATSQTADLQQWQTSAGTTVAAVTADGRVGVGTAPVSNSTLHIKMPGTKQGFIVTNGDSTGTQTWFGFTTGSGPLGTGNDEYVNFYKDANGWIWNSDKGGTGTARAVRWTHSGTERMKINGTGIGFLGATPAAQQTGGAATAGGTYGATEQSMLQKAYDCLRTFGLLS
ncbi:MAG: hypothetical protein U0871_24375 [Gemmataceae bacterium]